MIKRLLLIFVLIVGIAILYFTFVKKPETPATSATTSVTSLLKKVITSATTRPNAGSTPETSGQNPTASPEIIVDYPRPNDIVKSPLIVKGKAKGGWYFEGDFPVTLYYGVQDEFTDTHATAKGEWMTENYVDFEATVEFPKPYANDGLLVLRKNNPSDIKELNAEITIPVKFW